MGGTLLVDSLNLIQGGDLLQSGIQLLSSGWFEHVLDAGQESFAPLLADASPLDRVFANLSNWGMVALGLGFVIFVHELGHFLAAKTFGVRCDKFYVGFDVPISIGPIKFPRTLGKFKYGETEYGIGIIPLGGYVKMLGQDDDPRQAEQEAARARAGDGPDAPLDPRSYPAKAVWQRMIIISAGVVMNLIFAVILAAIAFMAGVPYSPTIARGTFGGAPAWEAGIRPNDQVIAFDKMTEENLHLRYPDFATDVAVRGLEHKDKPLSLKVIRGDERLTVMLTPSSEISMSPKRYMIGMISQDSTTFYQTPIQFGSFLKAKPLDILPNDKVVGVDGVALTPNPLTGQLHGSDLEDRLEAKYREPVTLQIERSASGSSEVQTIDVTIPAVPMKYLGVGFAPGPITAIRNGSLGKEIGFQVGDIIESINGEPVVDAFRIPDQLARLAGQTVKVVVRRPLTTKEPSAGDTAIEKIELTFDNPASPKFDPVSDTGGKLTLPNVGVAFEVTPIISSVERSLIDDTEVQPGDELLQIQWLISKEERTALDAPYSESFFEPIVIDKKSNVASLMSAFQNVPAGSAMKLSLKRDGKTRELTTKLVDAEDWYSPDRGLIFKPLTVTRYASGIGEAFSLGLNETSRRFGEVLNFLRLLFTGYVSSDAVGGPISIAQIASSEASNGVSRLLLFLTFLSANLAILNFLPIPALDGGHMVFLIAEAIRGKPVDENLQMRLTMAGVLGLLCLMVFVIFKDIMRNL